MSSLFFNDMDMMKRLIILLVTGFLMTGLPVSAQSGPAVQDTAVVAVTDSTAQDSTLTVTVDDEALLGAGEDPNEKGGFHKELKRKFVDGNAGFMSLVALALVLGLAFCIERILYLMMSEIKARKLMEDIR